MQVLFELILLTIVLGEIQLEPNVVELISKVNTSWATDIFKGIDVDAYLNVDELLTKYGYASENHFVTTDDGYNLALHRIPKAGYQPVLLVHGLFCSSSCFLMMGPNSSLAYYLSDQKYDVWLGNTRGSLYSQNHTQLSTNELKFWKFSFHEIGIYDLPAMIEYIRKETSFHQIYFIGHSQGATAFFVMNSLRPEYNEKVSIMQALSPIVFLDNIKIKPCFLKKIEEFLMSSVSRTFMEIFPNDFPKTKKCLLDSFTIFSCLETIFEIIGSDSGQFNQSMANVVFKHFPAGGSIKQIRHFHQIYKSGLFQAFNYGLEGNYERYDKPQPLVYNLTIVETPVALHFGYNDYLSTVNDVQQLYKNLRNIVGLYLVPLPEFNHMDFIWAKDVRKLVYERITNIFNDFESGTLHYVIE